MKKQKKHFLITASALLFIALASWFGTQKTMIGPVQDAILMSILNIGLHGVTLWFVLRIAAWWFFRK